MNQKGFSLTELITVMAILGIILAITTLDFSTMTQKSQIERHVRETLTDLNTARMDSIFRKTRHAVIFKSGGYIMKRYSSVDEAYFGDDTQGIVLTKSFPYQFVRAGSGASLVDSRILFDERGATNDSETIRITPTNSSAAVDCIAIHIARTNIGKMEGTNCVQR